MMENTYTSYIPINQKWMKKMPAHWEAKRLKSIFALRKEKNNPIVTDNILSLTAKQGVIPYAEKEDVGGNKPKEDLTLYNIAHENDLLVNCMNVVSGAAGVSRYYGAISPVYYALFPRKNDNVWYYHYIFRLLPFQRSLVGLGKGIQMHESEDGTLTTVRMRISMDSLGNVLLPIPPRTEQDQIVRFLDWKVSSINRLININRKKLSYLDELKKSIIAHMVTQGLSKSNQKSTEIYWLKTIPDDWKETKLKHILRKHQRPIPLNADLLICSNSGEVKIRGDEKIGLVAMSNDIYQGVSKGDLLIHGMDTWHGAIAISNYDGMCTPVVHVCSCSQSKRFVAYYLKMMAYTKVFKAISNGVRQNTSDFRSWNKVGDLLIAFPDINTQELIADSIDTNLGKISVLQEKAAAYINMLVELKTRLIADTVTGKIDVRNIEIPEYEFVGEESQAEEELDVEGNDNGE